MREFNQLRALARGKRDKIVAAARADYEATLVQIAKLEQDLLGKVSSRYRKISAAIESVIPSDRTFTTADILAGLEAMDPGRVWRKRSIDSHLSRLRERGLVKRLRKATLRERAVYARADLGTEGESRPLREYIGDVLVKPMTVTEVAVAVVEAGYRTTMKGRGLRNHVARELREGGYRRGGERWLP
ncbi:MAG: hypothetical protein WD875_11035 [Pirellulales bacterium]